MKKILGIFVVLLLALQMMIPQVSADEDPDPQGVIAGDMFHDADLDGMKDAGEAPLVDWTVELYQDDVLVATTQSGSDGSYEFTGLAAGTYVVKETVAEGWEATTPTEVEVTITATQYVDLDDMDIPDEPMKLYLKWPGSATSSYFTATIQYLDGQPYGVFRDWCIDLGHTVYQNSWYTAALISSLDEENIPTWVDYPENMDLVNYVLNQDYTGIGADYRDVQGAIWRLIDTVGPDQVSGGSISWHDAHADAIVADAQANGGGFLPSCESDVVGVILKPILRGTSEVGTELNAIAQIQVAQIQLIELGVECQFLYSSSDVYFGAYPLGTINGYKFYDANMNGEWDDTEAAIEGWEMELWKDGVYVATTSTDDMGFFEFDQLVIGEYVVKEELVDGWYATTATSVTTDVEAIQYIDLNDMDLPDDPVKIKLQWPGYATGSYFTATINEFDGTPIGVFEDWCIDLGHVIYTNSWYAATMISTLEPENAPSWVDYEENLDLVNYVLNQDYSGIGADYKDIQGAIWRLVDANIDDDTVVAGSIRWDDGRADIIVNDARAHGDGFLPDCENDVVGVILNPIQRNPGTTPPGGDPAMIAQVQVAQIQLIELGVECQFLYTNVDPVYFGNVEVFTISGNVFRDENNDGVWDSGEGIIPGVPVTLSGTYLDGETDHGTEYAIADEFGNYEFVNLPPGDYELTVPSDWSADGRNFDLSTDKTLEVMLRDADSEDNDFGFAPLYDISGYVWQDYDMDGAWDATELPMDGIVVSLYDGDGLMYAVVTDENGYYLFDDEYYGDYTVAVGDSQVWGGRNHVLTTPSALGASIGPDSWGNNFGYVPLYDISGRVYLDANLNGDYDMGEPTFPMVTVVLAGTDLSGEAWDLTATTGGDGMYLFEDVPPGDYTVTVPEETPDIDGDLNELLEEKFYPTEVAEMPLSVAPDSVENDFGHAVDTDLLIEELPEYDGTGKTIGFWKHQFQAHLKSSKKVRAHVDRDTLEGYIVDIEAFFLEEPFQFNGDGFQDAFDMMKKTSSNPVDLLNKQLLASELNYMSGWGLDDDMVLMGFLLQWGEYMSANYEEFSPDQVIEGKDIFDYINNSGE